MNLLITSAGGLVGMFLLRHFSRTCPDIKLIAIDANQYTGAKALADKFYVSPKADADCYLEFIQKIINIENIDGIFPVSSHDMHIFTRDEIKRELSQYNLDLFIMNQRNYDVLFDKYTCYAKLRDIGIRTPEIIIGRPLKYPAILKARKDTGGKRTIKLEDDADYNYWSKKIDDAIICEYVKGREYTVDCLFHSNYSCIGYNIRERIKMSGGGAIISQNAHVADMDDVIDKMVKSKIFIGAVNFQFRTDDDGNKIVFDVNTRLASGGLPLTVQTGFDIPCLLLRLMKGENIPCWKRATDMENLCMVKFYNEIYYS